MIENPRLKKENFEEIKLGAILNKIKHIAYFITALISIITSIIFLGLGLAIVIILISIPQIIESIKHFKGKKSDG